jgi:thiamine-monophosphate kinase
MYCTCRTSAPPSKPTQRWQRWPAASLEFVIAGGDDYELLFTAAPGQRDAVQSAARQADTRVTRIGRIDGEPGLRVIDGSGRRIESAFPSFDHFA